MRPAYEKKSKELRMLNQVVELKSLPNLCQSGFVRISNENIFAKFILVNSEIATIVFQSSDMGANY